jgi:isopenicillin-N N-acyltransferase-like protein
VEDLFRVLPDHANHPRSICKHPSKPGPFADMTLASIVIDLDARTMWMTQGNPCENPYEKWDVFAAPSPEASTEGAANAAVG